MRFRAQLTKGEQVGVQTAPADLVAAGPGQHGLAQPRQQRCGEQERASDLRSEGGIERELSQRRGVALDGVLARALDAGAESLHDLDEHLDVPDARDVVDPDKAPETSNAAASSGSASFLFPLGVIDPLIGNPPSISNRSLSPPSGIVTAFSSDAAGPD